MSLSISPHGFHNIFNSQAWFQSIVLADSTPSCEDCNALVKPDIVFFGENLPRRFFERTSVDFPACDLLIVMGTSLVVQPFASMIDEVGKDCPRLLINREKAGTVSPLLAYLGVHCVENLKFNYKH